MKTLDKNNLKISVLLYNFINEEVIPGTNIESGKFWEGFSNAVQFKPIEIILAIVVFPTPLIPVNKNAWASLSESKALVIVLDAKS